jgi:hypothetical protein
MDRRTLTFITISVLIIILYQELILKRMTPPPTPDAPMQTSSPDLGSGTPPGAPSQAQAPLSPTVRRNALDAPIAGPRRSRAATSPSTRTVLAVFSTLGGRSRALRQEAPATNEPGSPPLELTSRVRDRFYDGAEPRGARCGGFADRYQPRIEQLQLGGDGSRASSCAPRSPGNRSSSG